MRKGETGCRRAGSSLLGRSPAARANWGWETLETFTVVAKERNEFGDAPQCWGVHQLLQRGQGRAKCPVLKSKSFQYDPEEGGLEPGAVSRRILGKNKEA